jgi:hypothetical protein
MKISHLKGIHNSFPFLVKAFAAPLKMRFEFFMTEENIYTIEGENQYDWNKLTGLKALFFKPMYDTVMVGWLWHPEKQCFQFIPYFHLGGPAHKFDDRLIINALPNQKCVAEIEIKDNTNVIMTLTNTVTGQTVTDSRWFSKKYNRFWLINSWFGGQSTCTKNMTLNINF